MIVACWECRQMEEMRAVTPRHTTPRYATLHYSGLRYFMLFHVTPPLTRRIRSHHHTSSPSTCIQGGVSPCSRTRGRGGQSERGADRHATTETKHRRMHPQWGAPREQKPGWRGAAVACEARACPPRSRGPLRLSDVQRTTFLLWKWVARSEQAPGRSRGLEQSLTSLQTESPELR